MRMFRLSETWLGSSAGGGSDNDQETDYHLTTLEASLTHILTGGLKSNGMEEFITYYYMTIQSFQ